VLVGRCEAKDEEALARLLQQLDDQLAQSGVQRTESAAH
jgi:phosphomannomutase